MPTRPISSNSPTRSTTPTPTPPYTSGKMRPSHPCSASFAQNSGVVPSGVSISLRTVGDGHSFSRNLRAVARRSSCSSLKPKSTRALSLRQAEHALADDVLLDLRGPALDRVGARAQERVLPEPVLDRPVAALHELRVGALDLHRELLESLVGLHPAHLPGRRLRTGHLTLEEPRDRPGARILQALGVDPELRDLLAHDRVLGDGAAGLL